MRLAVYARVYAIAVRNNMIREFIYRTNLFTALIIDITWITIEFGLFSILYAQSPLIGGWNKEQTFFFLAVYFTSDAIFTILFNRNFWMFPALVNQGELDILLTKPIHPLFLALTRYVNTVVVLNLVAGVWLMHRWGVAAGFAGGWRWLGLVGWLVVANYTALQLRFLFSVSVFWLERGAAVSRLFHHLSTLGTKPDVLYPWVVRRILLSVLPFAFIASVPARALLFGLEASEYFGLVLTLGVLTMINCFLWRASLRRYQSASS